MQRLPFFAKEGKPLLPVANPDLRVLRLSVQKGKKKNIEVTQNKPKYFLLLRKLGLQHTPSYVFTLAMPFPQFIRLTYIESGTQ